MNLHIYLSYGIFQIMGDNSVAYIFNYRFFWELSKFSSKFFSQKTELINILAPSIYQFDFIYFTLKNLSENKFFITFGFCLGWNFRREKFEMIFYSIIQNYLPWKRIKKTLFLMFTIDFDKKNWDKSYEVWQTVQKEYDFFLTISCFCINVWS